jgi:hypothetical protein
MFIQTHVTRLKAISFWCANQRRRRQLVIDKLHQKQKKIGQMSLKKLSEAG